jgi:hypothetical protein
MKEHAPMLMRGECEKCGAPLSRGAHKGEFVCHYCGAVYYDKAYTDRHWDEDIERPKPEPSPKPQAPPPSVRPTRKKGTLLILAGVGSFIALCLVIGLLSSMNNASSSRASDAGSTQDQPDMLEALPQAVNAGTAVAYGGWELTFSPEISTDGNKLSFSFTLKNWHDSNQTFSYQPNSIVVYDNIGNTYPLYLGNCEPDLPHLDRQITFRAYEEIAFQSSTSWCSRENKIPVFFGVIPQNAQNIYVHFEAFGVFQNITFVFEL